MLLNRLIGIQTEYATVLEPREGKYPRRSEVYASIRSAIESEQPTAPDRFDATKRFLASGGAISAEFHPADDLLPGGLIECTTPEVRSPEALLACQRAQDRMMQTAADRCDFAADLRLLKNSGDRPDRYYGCQESYEAIVATGWRLVLYRLAVMMLLPLQWLCLTGSFALVTIATAGLGIARIASALGRLRFPSSETLFAEPPLWGLRLVVGCLRIMQFPIVTALSFLARWLAFSKQRRYLAGFLMSRLAITGSGHLDERGKYWLSAKAMSIDCHTAIGSYRGERPMFVFRHWLEQVCGESLFQANAVTRLLRRKQRLLIGLSDSNIAEMAEYLKMATTSLVLDMLESDWPLTHLPIVRRPVASLHRIAADWNLVSQVPTSRGEMSAFEIQALYLNACRAFVLAQGDQAPAEAIQVLDRWEATLQAVAAFRANATAFQPAIGKIDWLTKRWLLDQRSDEASWAVRKEVDLRYHELSPASYFDRICSAGATTQLIDEQAIERAGRMPPRDTQAGRRGHLIREFFGGEQPLRASWSHVFIGRGRSCRVVRLDQD